jgi:hypothetical protein
MRTDALEVARLCAGLTNKSEHVYGETSYVDGSWDNTRRVIFKAEVMRADGKQPRDNPRLVVTIDPALNDCIKISHSFRKNAE